MNTQSTPSIYEQVNALRIDPARLANEVIDLGEAWADLNAAASSLEETKKTVLAKRALDNMSSALNAGKRGVSATQAELQALADPTYEEHLEMMVTARKEANRARVRYDMGRLRLELIRTAQATMRNEMAMGRHTT